MKQNVMYPVVCIIIIIISSSNLDLQTPKKPRDSKNPRSFFFMIERYVLGAKRCGAVRSEERKVLAILVIFLPYNEPPSLHDLWFSSSFIKAIRGQNREVWDLGIRTPGRRRERGDGGVRGQSSRVLPI